MAPKAIVYLEGNIASGKSSLLVALSGLAQCKVVTEPVEVWENTGMLELFYHKKIEATSFQSMVTSTHFAKLFRAIAAASPKDIIICERSLLIGTQAFADVCITDFAARSAHSICVKELATLLPSVPTYYIYLDTPAKHCVERLRERNRDSERDVTEHYLKQVETSHRTFMLLHENDIPIMVLDGTKQKEQVVSDFKSLMNLKLDTNF